LDLAQKYFHESYKESQSNEILRKLIGVARERNDLETLEWALMDYLESGNSELETLDLLGMTYIKQQKYIEALAIYEQMAKQSESPEIWKRLASLYAKTGDMEKAKEILLAISIK